VKLLQSYVAKNVSQSVLVVLFVILSLDLISDFIDQLGNLKGNYTIVEAAIYVLLYIPSSICDYLPLASLVGCLVGLGMLANSSELTVMRAAGVSISRVVWSVFRPIFVFIILGALIAEFVSPYLDQYADSRRALAQGHRRALESDKGLWLREGNSYIHINAVLPNGKLYGITRYEFDKNRQLIAASFVDTAIFQGDHWFEQDGRVTYFQNDKLLPEKFQSKVWKSDISPDLLNVLVLQPSELPVQRLHDYVNYLQRQSLDSSDYSLAFWQKTLQPLATLSLVIIAISFVMGPLRQVTMGFRVFIGVLAGLTFQTSMKLLGPSSIILGYPPLLAVLLPILCCFAIGWVLLRRV